MALTHTERWELAQTLVERLADRFGAQILLGGVYGSTARGADTPWSDLELLLVTTDDSALHTRYLLYRGTAVTYQAVRRGELEEALATATAQWPWYMGLLSVLRVLHGDPRQVEAWLSMGRSAPPERFRATLEESLPGLVFESYGRILSCQLRGNRRDIGVAVIEVLLEMRTALCLLNRRWVTHDYYEGLQETLAFPRLPAGYAELFPALWDAREAAEIVPLARRLFAAFMRLIRDEGIRVSDYQDASDLWLDSQDV